MYTKLKSFFIRCAQGFPLIPQNPLRVFFSDALRLSNTSQTDKQFIRPLTVSVTGFSCAFWGIDWVSCLKLSVNHSDA